VHGSSDGDAIQLVMRLLIAAVACALSLAPAFAKGSSGDSSSGHVRSTASTATHSRRSATGTRITRSSAARRSFKTQNPCPATGKATGACPGYAIDHRVPLACGEADAPENMAWQTATEAKRKDRTERAGCR